MFEFSLNFTFPCVSVWLRLRCRFWRTLTQGSAELAPVLHLPGASGCETRGCVSGYGVLCNTTRQPRAVIQLTTLAIGVVLFDTESLRLFRLFRAALWCFSLCV